MILNFNYSDSLRHAGEKADLLNTKTIIPLHGLC